MSILVVTAILITVFFSYSLLIVVEEKRGNRLALTGLRTWCDRMILRLGNYTRYIDRFVVRRSIILSWYYSLHAILKALLQVLAGLYFAIEQIFIRNRNKARRLRRTEQTSHLTVLSEHQKVTALSESEKKKRKEKALKG